MLKLNLSIEKFKIILCITIFCFLLFLSNNVFAENKKLVVDNYDMSDIYNYFAEDEAFFIVKIGDRYLFYMPINNNYKKYCAIKNNYISYFNENWFSLEGNNYKFYYFNADTNKFDYAWTGAYDSFKYNAYPVLYASKGIYNADHKTFFLTPPPPKVEITETLIQEMGKVQVMEKMKTTIVGYLKYLIALVVSVIAFYKGWQFLSKNFKRA